MAIQFVEGFTRGIGNEPATTYIEIDWIGGLLIAVTTINHTALLQLAQRVGETFGPPCARNPQRGSDELLKARSFLIRQ